VASFEVLSMVVSRTRLGFFSCFLSCVLWFCAADLKLATAQEKPAAADTDARARRAFEAGRDAYDHGSFTAALAHFEQAYALRPSPELLYNVGRAADSDGQPSRAIAAYSSYLEAYPNAENRDFVHARLEKMRVLERAHSSLAGADVANRGLTSEPSAGASTAPQTLPSVAQSTRSEQDSRGPTNTAALAARRDDETARPVWKRAWFWTTAGVLVAGGVVAGVLASRPRDPQRAAADEYVFVPGVR